MAIEYKNIARVIRPHGTKGEVLVVPLRGLPLLLQEGMCVALTPPAFSRDRFCNVLSVKPVPDGALIRFSGCNNLDDATTLQNCTVLARADDISLGSLVHAVDDLLGREIIDKRHGRLGTITQIMETPANDVWIVEGDQYGEVLIPVIDSVIPSIPNEGPIPVCIMDGLLDL